MGGIIDWWMHWWETDVLGNGFTPVEMIALFIGFGSWVYTYIIIIKQINRNKVCEMPIIVAPGNYAWEALWSWVFWPILGWPFKIGVVMWFLLDTYINVNCVLLMKKTNRIQWIIKRRWFIWLGLLAGWIGMLFAFTYQGLDDQLGVASALMINVVMSGAYLLQLFRFPDLRGKGISFKAAVFKMIGTGSIWIAMWHHWPDHYFMIALGAVSFVLDMMYIILFKTYKAPTDSYPATEVQPA